MSLGPNALYAVSATPRSTLRTPSAVERLGIAGPGLFLRSRVTTWYPLDQMASTFTWACIPVINGNRAATNRNSDYARSLVRRGVTVTGFDWLPRPGNWENGLEGAIRFIADVGGRGFVLDAEAEFRGAPAQAQRYADRARELCDRFRIWLGFSSFGIPPGNLPLRPFCAAADVVIPQTYDRYHDLRANYVMESARRYFNAGATRFSFGSGAYRGTAAAVRAAEGAEADRARTTWRWRTGAELEAHLAMFPWFVESVISWPLAGAPPADVWDAYRTWWSRRRLGGGG